MTSPFLKVPGAVDSTGTGSPTHYGNPLAEQRRLVAGDAIVDLSHRAVLTITGPDRLTWLNSISSQKLLGLRAGESTETLLLDQTGRIQHAMRLLDDGETLWLLVDGADAPGILDWLVKMRFMLRVELENRTADYATIGAAGAVRDRLPVASSNGVPLIWHDPWAAVAAGGYQYAQIAEHPGRTWDWSEALISRAEYASLAERATSGEFAVAGVLAAEAIRIAAWRPGFSSEVDERAIPHELDWLRTAVHLNKGCYRGQETVAKVHNLGHPPRRLVLLHLDGSEGVLPVPGDAVWLQGDGERRVVGRVTSSAIHYELGPIALAVIKRSTDALATLTVEADGALVPAAQVVIVPPDAGGTAHPPRLPRLGAVSR